MLHWAVLTTSHSPPESCTCKDISLVSHCLLAENWLLKSQSQRVLSLNLESNFDINMTVLAQWWLLSFPALCYVLHGLWVPARNARTQCSQSLTLKPLLVPFLSLSCSSTLVISMLLFYCLASHAHPTVLILLIVTLHLLCPLSNLCMFYELFLPYCWKWLLFPRFISFL